MKHALISGQIYRNDDGTKDIEIFTKIDNDNRITDIFDDVDHALLEQIEPNFEIENCYFFIAFVESKFVTTSYPEGIEHEVEHDVTELKGFKDLPQAIVSNEPPSSVATAAVEGILTEEELKERNRKLVLENDELNAENIKVKQALKKVKDHLEGVMDQRRFVILDGPGMINTLSQALEELK